ncbi:uncharacterized protein LOC116930007 isoform X1 [Daphnia magna]|uniref:uncharacterized protein LOC116930007 isoform X1 n=1 Tax=Daphnia magna TaxID=35525 RepID=UPI001E1BA360|nr:uncharacterized protein LOC116930007 isoform X1 [Daphnia magna]
MEHSDLTQPLAHLGLVELTGGSSSSSFADRPSKVKLDDAIHLGVNGSDDPFFTTASRLDLEPTTAGPHELSPVELAGVIVAAALVTVAIIGLGVWMHCRRKKSKSQETTGGRMNGPHHPVAPQVSVISMETDVRPAGQLISASNVSSAYRSQTIAVRQNSYGSTGYIGSHGPYRMDGGSGGQSEEDEMGSFTDYGSIVGSFPPSPAGSFRSALDAPGFSRSRAGTGTSFATVKSFGSYRSRASNTASFHTCVEEEFS